MEIFKQRRDESGMICIYLFGLKIAHKFARSYFIGKNEWYTGWHEWRFELSYHECGWNSGNGELHISLLGWHSIFKMPWKSKRYQFGNIDVGEWGIVIDRNMLWLNYGRSTLYNKKYIAWALPFFWTSQIAYNVLCERDGKEVWLHPNDENKKFIKHFDCLINPEKTDKIVPHTYYMNEIVYGRKWLSWIPIFNKHVRSVIVTCSDNVDADECETFDPGNSYICSFTLLKNETPLECIKRNIVE